MWIIWPHTADHIQITKSIHRFSLRTPRRQSFRFTTSIRWTCQSPSKWARSWAYLQAGRWDLGHRDHWLLSTYDWKTNKHIKLSKLFQCSEQFLHTLVLVQSFRKASLFQKQTFKSKTFLPELEDPGDAYPALARCMATTQACEWVKW